MIPIRLFPHLDPMRYTSGIVSVPKITLGMRAADSVTPNIVKDSAISAVLSIPRVYATPERKTAVPVSRIAVAAIELIASSIQNDWEPRSYILRMKPDAVKRTTISHGYFSFAISVIEPRSQHKYVSGGT